MLPISRASRPTAVCGPDTGPTRSWLTGCLVSEMTERGLFDSHEAMFSPRRGPCDGQHLLPPSVALYLEGSKAWMVHLVPRLGLRAGLVDQNPVNDVQLVIDVHYVRVFGQSGLEIFQHAPCLLTRVCPEYAQSMPRAWIAKGGETRGWRDKKHVMTAP